MLHHSQICQVLAVPLWPAGDYSPTYWATQLMLIALLMITFTLLPYLTGKLMLHDVLRDVTYHDVLLGQLSCVAWPAIMCCLASYHVLLGQLSCVAWPAIMCCLASYSTLACT
jgi:hypothetical protein